MDGFRLTNRRVWVIETKCATNLPSLFLAGECAGTRYLSSYHWVSGFGLTGSTITGVRAGIGTAGYTKQVSKPEFTIMRRQC